jgi:hypothetical protein
VSGTSLSEPSPRLVSDSCGRSELYITAANSGICQSVEELQEEDVRRQGAVKGPVRPEAPTRQTRNVYFQLLGLEDVVCNDFITYEFIPDGDGQVLSGSASLPDPVVLETEDQTLKREQHECDVLETVGDSEYTCDTGMSVENVSVVVHIKTL